MVYVIKNDSREKVYIGYTSDLEKRLARHNNLLPNKKSSYTSKNGGVWELAYSEKFTTRTEATKREKELKSAKGRSFLKSRI